MCQNIILQHHYLRKTCLVYIIYKWLGLLFFIFKFDHFYISPGIASLLPIKIPSYFNCVYVSFRTADGKWYVFSFCYNFGEKNRA